MTKCCEHCGEADVELIPADYPYNLKHWGCPNCDSTYVFEYYPVKGKDMSDKRVILPLQLAMLMQVHVDPDFLPEQTGSESANKDWLMDQDLIQIPPPMSRGGSIYQTTEKGRAYIDHICNLPLPVAEWTIPQVQNEH